MQRLTRRSLLAAGALLALPNGALALEAERAVALQPLGTAPSEADLALVERALFAFYGLRVERLPEVALPRSAFYAPRRRWRAEKILAFLEEKRKKAALRVVGITTADISTTKGDHADWGILGLAELGGTPCVVSSFRCRRGTKSAEHARVRLGKVVVHELGHTLGLPHCPTRGCLMEDAGGKAVTTDREYDLCSLCRGRLAELGWKLGAGPPPWQRPSA
jgi:archaemetzincin